ncbi:TIGR03016 family PEP-CTERM system-associated outer membrane protein [Seongchinamella sediminis]|uniref:TIGR03016 family PEP-CTERM system-associated outer membrane protein n=1 Tax=Seongchinamella sediminis TaxID=2283635 RepID=A0A3L7DXN9_9GAMM|nr:TIGR03016 family PEP-CTERM system-associated outer membrane protein [Seongchinamella sediminis]RLQ20751.1 TIGR03016 family PEP-CTERM system-associated outer membrane protein [Seongchinamella sediminis]
MLFPATESRPLQNLGKIFLGLALAQGAAAAQWTTSAGVGTSLVYTDNACLSESAEQDEVYATVTPRAGISGEGRRANVALSASITANSLTDSRLEDLGCTPAGAGRDDYFPRINGSAYAELIEQWLYIDASLNVSQNSVNPFAPGAGDPQDRTGNTNTTYRYAVSPYVSRQFKDVANLLLRYRWSDQYNSKDVVGDSARENVRFLLDSVPGTSSLSWGLQADYDNIEYEERGDRPASNSELKSAQVNLGYQLNRHWQVNGYAGEEWNDFVSLNDEIDGSYWDVGVRWTPNSRTVVDVGTGDRFFGSTPRFSAQYYHKRSTLSASYARTLSYDRNIRTLDGFFPEDFPIFLFDPETGEFFQLDGAPTTISNSPIVDERFRLAYSYQGRRSNFSVAASQSEQRRLEDGRDSTFRGVVVSLNRNLSSTWTATGTVSWDEREPLGERSESVNQSETWRLRLSADRPITDWINFVLSYQYTDRQSEQASQQYQENRITATLRFTF